MGAACNKCNDVKFQRGLGAPKPLDASSSEEEEESEDEEEDNDGQGMNEEEKNQAESFFSSELKKGKTRVWDEAIQHSRTMGLDEQKISRAEAKLEEHKRKRRCELFEAELQEYLDDVENVTLPGCYDMQQRGQNHGLSEAKLDPLMERIAELERVQSLNDEEISQANYFLELATRRFTSECVVGRPCQWLDLETGRKKKCTMTIDKILQNIWVTGLQDSQDKSNKVMETSVKFAVDADEVFETKGFAELQADEKDLCWALVNTAGNQSTWCFFEERREKAVEAFCAMNMLCYAGKLCKAPAKNGGLKSPKSPKGSPRSPKGGGLALANVPDGEAGPAPVSPRRSVEGEEGMSPAAARRSKRASKEAKGGEVEEAVSPKKGGKSPKKPKAGGDAEEGEDIKSPKAKKDAKKSKRGSVSGKAAKAEEEAEEAAEEEEDA